MKKTDLLKTSFNSFKNLNTSSIQDVESLEEVVQLLATNIEDVQIFKNGQYNKTLQSLVE